jgi:hypothetical protein
LSPGEVAQVQNVVVGLDHRPPPNSWRSSLVSCPAQERLIGSGVPPPRATPFDTMLRPMP